MMRGLLSSGICGAALALVSAAAAAEELPLRKPGLWEMKIVKVGSQLPELTTQQCTDQTVDKDMVNTVSPIAKQICSRQNLQKTAAGYINDSVCTVAGATITSHSEISGDFDSAYTVTTQAHTDKGPETLRDTTTRIEAKWLGDCKAGQKPGDIVMPGGGFRLNVKDAEKLKNLLPPKTN
ncbi:MAG: DUF3617 family protein [Bradyrhizobium sp.]|nr:DUF3617 family protein [Bradyrhizobium sp.]